MKFILLLLVFVFGLLQNFQAGMNSTMSGVLGDRFQAGFINGFLNVCILTLVLMILWRGFPSAGLLKQAPWWAFLGGAIGAGIVVVQLSAAPILGAGLMVALFVAGQVTGSLIVDTWGLVGYPVRSISGLRLLALALRVVGEVLARITDVPVDAPSASIEKGTIES